jgi:uncharacterized protein YkwD
VQAFSRSFTKVLALSVGFFFVIFLAPAANAAVALSHQESRFLKAVNAVRRQYGRRPLRVDANLVRAARWQSNDMAARGYFAHGAFAQRMANFRVRGPRVGENLAWGQGRYAAPGHVVQLWLASPEHRANLLRAGFRRVGIGTAVGSYSGVSGAKMITADFAGW